MTSRNIYDVTVVGAGPAGMCAAIYAADSGMSVRLFERLGCGGQMAEASSIDNLPGFARGIAGADIAERMTECVSAAGVAITYSDVIHADVCGKIKAVTADGERHLSRSIIIATGAHPRALDIPGEKEARGHGLSYCAECDGRIAKGKRCAVIGGGRSAVSDALHLSAIADEVYLIHRGERLRVPEYEEKLIARNVRLMYSSEAAEILADSRVKALRIKNNVTNETQLLECEAVFAAIGRIPASEIWRGQVPLDPSGYIIAGEDTRTAVSGVFAAGDIRTKSLRQIVTALSDGAAAAVAAREFITS